jgi:hypothetical protein
MNSRCLRLVISLAAVCEPVAPGINTVDPEPDIVLAFAQEKVFETFTAAAPVRVPPASIVSAAISDASPALLTSSVPAIFSVPPPWTTPAACGPVLTLTVLPDPMHATSLAVGTFPVDHPVVECQLPSAAPVQVVVHSAAAAVDGEPPPRSNASARTANNPRNERQTFDPTNKLPPAAIGLIN